MQTPCPDMKIHREFRQGSSEWMMARAGIPTASEFDALVTPKWKIRTGSGVDTYLAKKVAEAWQGGPLIGFASSWATEQGKILEDEALPWYELETGERVDRVGLCTTDDGRVACSPDGLLGEDGGIEVKCPEVHTHVGYLLGGTVPEEYLAQVHGSMWVTGRPWWKFLSYRRHFPALMVEVERDDEIQDVIGQAVELFLERFDAAMARLTELNGGPPTGRPGAIGRAADPAWIAGA